MDTSGGRTVAFEPGDVSPLKHLFATGFRSIRAYGCLHCSHLQLAVDFNEADMQHYREFEGQQPGVLERIETETKQ